MKKLLSLTLCAALVAAPVQRPQASAAMAACLVGGFAITGGIVVFMLKTCRPKYYCVQDEDGNRFPSNATKKERQVNDWKVVGGPYNSAEAAKAACPPMTNAPTFTEQPTPSQPITIWKSSDLQTWTAQEVIQDDPAHFSWSQTNSASETAAFYRISY